MAASTAMEGMSAEQAREPLVPRPPPQLQFAHRTKRLLISNRCVFMFAHGLLILVASLVLGLEVECSWWTTFIPVLAGNILCLMMLVYSWFASWPYMNLCFTEREARLGDSNPSLLTELLPQILMGLMGFVFVLLALIGECLFCHYLEALRLHVHPEPSPWPSAVVMIIVSILAFVRGLWITMHSDIFIIPSGVTLLTLVLAFNTPDSLTGSDCRIILLPSLFGILCLLICAALRLKKHKEILYPEERRLYIAEQLVLLIQLAALVVYFVCRPQGADAGTIGAVVGGGICILSFLRTRLWVVEPRYRSICERLLVQAMGKQDHGINKTTGAFPQSLLPRSQRNNQSGGRGRGSGGAAKSSAKVLSSTPPAKASPPEGRISNPTLGARLGLAGPVGVSGPPVPQILGDVVVTPSEVSL